MADEPGADILLRNLGTLTPHLIAGLAVALYEEATRIMAASQPLVPVLTGLLRSTGAVETEGTPASDPVVALSYGGKGLAPYAGVVHERTDTHHPVGQHHYLSEPFFAATAGMEERLSATIRRHLGVS